MSSINFMEKLLDGVAVEWKALGELCSIGVGQAPAGNEIGEYAFVNAGTTPSGYVSAYNTEPNTITTPSRGQGGIGYVGYQTTRFWCGPLCYRIRSTSEMLSTRFLYHVMANSMKDIVGLANMAGVPALNKKELVGFPVPIPCPENPEKSLAIQAEIVRILDTFTELTTELTAELTARKKQYNYYRDQLLRFEEGEVEWKALGAICAIGDGLHGTPEYDDKGNYFFINGNNLDNGNIVLNDKTKKVNDSMFKKHGIIFTVENTVFLSINGTIGSVSFYNSEKIVLGKSVAFFNIKSSELYSRYLFYFLQTDFSKKYFETQKTGSTIKNLGLKALRSFVIPLPPLEVQNRIVTILDKFDALTSSITEGLPREIELRQKQYEHYRDLLLSFPSPRQM